MGLVDRNIGLEYCGESDDVYKMIIEAYIGEFEERREQMKQFLDSNDIKNYQITVHGLKSTSLSIGAVSLSEFAKEHEMAAKENNVSFITEKYEELMQLYQDVVEELKVILAE